MKFKVIFFLLISQFAHIQAQQIHWAHFISSPQSDNLECHALDKDENIIAVGYFEGNISIGDFQLSSKDQSDIFIYKTNKYGQVIWAHTFGGPVYGGDVGLSVDNEGNIYVAGGYINKLFFDDDLELTTPQNSVYWSSFVAKLSSNGTLSWIRGIFPSNLSEVRVWGNIDVNDEGSVAVAGMFGGTIDVAGTTLSNPIGFPGNSIFIARFDSDGQLVWVKNPPAESYATVGDIQLDNSSNIYVTGFFTNSIWFGTTKLTAANTTHSDIYVAKYSANGDALWAEGIIKTSTAELNNEGRGLCVDETTGNIYVTGNFKGTIASGSFTISGVNTSEDPGNADGFMASYNANGAIQWLKRVGTPNPDVLDDITLTNRNSFIVSGGIDGFNIFFEEFTLSGVSVLKKEFNGIGSAESISLATNGDIYLSGLLFGPLVEDAINFNPQGFDGFLLKYAPGEPVEPPASFIPNVITPGIDTFNDTFRVPYNMEGSPIAIYNRWGQLVYSDSEYKNTWDGGDHPSGVYFFHLRTYCCGFIKGTISVVR